MRPPRCTNAHAAIHRPGGNRVGHWHDKVWIVIFFFRTVVTEVNHLMPNFA